MEGVQSHLRGRLTHAMRCQRSNHLSGIDEALLIFGFDLAEYPVKCFRIEPLFDQDIFRVQD